MQQHVKKWDENTIRDYLSEEFPQASSDLVAKVTEAVYAEDKNSIGNIADSFRNGRNTERYPKFKTLIQNNGQNSVLLTSMLEGVHRRFTDVNR